MVAELSQRRPVFEIVGRPTSPGATWVWTQGDLTSASVGRARVDLSGLFAAGTCPRRVLLYVGVECVVDLRGLGLLLEVAAEVRNRGGALVVVAPPDCLKEVATLIASEEELPMIDSVRRAAWWARTYRGA